jgi:RES domain-containing protein
MSGSVTLWRVSNHESLDGIGGMYAGGRWHSKGQLVLYCSEDPSTALLETLVHIEIDAEDRPENFHVLKIESGKPVSTEHVKLEKAGPGWREDLTFTRPIGDEWLSSRRFLLLEVPSVLVPERRNFLLNPVHPEMKKMRITARYSHPFDSRFFR